MTLASHPPLPLSVRSVDLADLPDGLEDSERGVHLVVWHAGLALGAVDVPADHLPMTQRALEQTTVEAALPAVWGHLFAPDAEFLGPPTPRPPASGVLDLDDPWDELHRALDPGEQSAGIVDDLTVVVCTRDRPDDLARCLASLSELRPSPAEVIVVDNASAATATREVVECHQGVRYVREDRPGLDHARNAGLAAVTTAFVAYTDDDVVVDPRWIGQLRRAFDDGTVAVTGNVIPLELETVAQVVFEQDWGLGKGYVPRRFTPALLARGRRRAAPVWEIGAGANMAFRRDVFDQVGGFDPRLDVGAAGCSGDSELWYRLLAAGKEIRYVPTAVVHHRHRRDLPSLRKQIRGYMSGHTAALLVQYEHSGHVANLARLLLVLPRDFVRGLVARATGSVHPDRFLLFDQVWGSLAGVRYHLRHRR